MRTIIAAISLAAALSCGPASSQTGQSELVGPPPRPTAAGLCADPSKSCCLYWCHNVAPCDCTADNRRISPPDMAPPAKPMPPDEDF